MKKLLSILPIIFLVFGCSNKNESLKLVCHGTNYISSTNEGKLESTIPTTDIKFIFVVEDGKLSEVNYNRYKNIPCQKFSSNEILCSGTNKEDKIETKISVDRLNGTIKTHKESILGSRYILIDQYEGKCENLKPKF